MVVRIHMREVTWIAMAVPPATPDFAAF